MTGRVGDVHGIGNRQHGTTPAEAASVLGRRWTAALRRGLAQDCGLPAVVAYYGHHLAIDTAVQSTLGLGVGVLVYAVAFGGLFAVAFVFAYGRIGPLTPAHRRGVSPWSATWRPPWCRS